MIQEAQVEQIEEFASLLFTPRQIVTILQLDTKDFDTARLKQDDFNLPYQRGKLKREAEIRKKIFELAAAGSAPAQTMAIQLMEDHRKNEIDL